MDFSDGILRSKLYNEPYAIVTILSLKGIGPRSEGRMCVFSDSSIYGTIGGGKAEKKAIDSALIALKNEKGFKENIKVRESGEIEVFIDPVIKKKRVVIVGSGHVAVALSSLLYKMLWQVDVVDNRKEIIKEDEFPHAKLYFDQDLNKALLKTKLDEKTAVIITNPEGAEVLFDTLKNSPCFFIGMLGSRKRENPLKEKMTYPIGLSLGGESVEEVALSLASELTAAFYKKTMAPVSSFKENLVIIRGGGDLATGIAVRVKKAGYFVIILEIENPSVIRRTVSLASSFWEKEVEIEGIKGVLAKSVKEAIDLAENVDTVPVLIDQDAKILKEIKPFALVDAIIAKKNLGTTKGMAECVIGVGPGFSAPSVVDAVIETKRGHDLGRVIYDGTAAPNSGIPGIIEGYGKERVMHSENSGVFKTVRKIGDIVEKGEVIAYVGTTPVLASVSGMLRGLLHDNLEIPKDFKVADIDPRGLRASYLTISDKARSIGGGVLEALDNAKRKSII